MAPLIAASRAPFKSNIEAPSRHHTFHARPREHTIGTDCGSWAQQSTSAVRSAVVAMHAMSMDADGSIDREREQAAPFRRPIASLLRVRRLAKDKPVRLPRGLAKLRSFFASANAAS